MIRIENISKTFNKGSVNEVKALENISLVIPEKEFLVVVGANGSGKSTLLNTLAGSFKVDLGKIWIDTKEVSKLNDVKRSLWIARIFQNPLSGTAPKLSVLENFRLASLRTQKKTLNLGINQKFVEEVKEKVSLLEMGLENKLNQIMGSLSGGQRQALTLIMAIMDEAQIILLDEPTAALDPKSAQVLMQNLDKIQKEFELTTLLITHQLKEAKKHGTRIIQMAEGKILRDVPKSEKDKLNIEDIMRWFT